MLRINSEFVEKNNLNADFAGYAEGFCAEIEVY
jgi:hypothetical protein